MADEFEAKIDKIVAKAEQNLLIVMRESISKVVYDAQTPVKKGGRMRVDTGFLKFSGVAALNEMPRGETEGRKRNAEEVGVLAEYVNATSNLNTVLANMKIGDTFYWGWTARYAKYREVYDGFLESALQKWSQFVDESVKELKK